MEKEIKNGIIKGYEIGKEISIHTHITDPESWFVTIIPLRVFGQSLCKKDCTEAEIVRHLHILLYERLNILNELIKDVALFT